MLHTGQKVLLAEGSRGHSLPADLGSGRLPFQEESGRPFLHKLLPNGPRSKWPAAGPGERSPDRGLG